MVDGWLRYRVLFLDVSLTLPFVRGDSKFEMGDRKCPLDVRGKGVKRPAY